MEKKRKKYFDVGKCSHQENDYAEYILRLKTTIPNLFCVKKRRYRISLTFKNDDTETFLCLQNFANKSVLSLKTTISNSFLNFKNNDTESFLRQTPNQKGWCRQKSRGNFRRFWLDKNDNTDNILCLKTDHISTKEMRRAA